MFFFVGLQPGDLIAVLETEFRVLTLPRLVEFLASLSLLNVNR